MNRPHRQFPVPEAKPVKLSWCGIPAQWNFGEVFGSNYENPPPLLGGDTRTQPALTPGNERL
jgi:hypothetical protein